MSNGFNSFGGNNTGFSSQPFAAEQTPLTGGFSSAPNSSALGAVHPFANEIGGFSSGPQFDTTMTTGVPKPTEFSQGAIKSVRVISCNFCEMVEQANMGFRPFVSNLTNSNVLEQIPQFVREQRHGANFRAESFNTIVNDIVSLSSNTMGGIPMVNGWATKRYSYTIMAEVVRSNGNTQNYMIEGFTDTNNLNTFGGIKIDPQMVLYVNNVVSFAQRSNLHTAALSMVPVETFNVISQDPFQQGAPVKDYVTQRPYDVANMNLGGILGGNASTQIIDSRSSVATDPKTSNLSNNNAASYIGKIINDGINAIGSTNTDNLFNTATMRTMIDTVAEPTLARNGFLQTLGKISRDFNTAVASFTWKDLTSLDAALLNPNCKYLNVYTNENRPVHMPSSGFACDDIGGSGHEQVFAQTIANGVSDIMSRCDATEITAIASNHSGMDEVEVTGMRCYDQTKLQINIGTFQQLFLSNIMMMVNMNTQFSYNVVVQSTVWGETFVKINLGHGTFTFLFPNFANSMYSPMLTNNKVGTTEISRHLLSVANKINNEQYKMLDDNQSKGIVLSSI